MTEVYKMYYTLPIEDFSTLKDDDRVQVTWLIGDENSHFLHDEAWTVSYKEAADNDLIICGLMKEMDVEDITRTNCKRYDLMYNRSKQKFFNLLSIGAISKYRRTNIFQEEVQDTEHGVHWNHHCVKVIKKY